MKPVILVTAAHDPRGTEFGDDSISLSNLYCRQLAVAGATPVIVPLTNGANDLDGYLRLAQGILITGGEDLFPDRYAPELPADVAATVKPGSRERDELEYSLIRAAAAKRIPFLGICRGHQAANVAFGGGLIADITTQMPDALPHRDAELGCGLTHAVRIESGSLLDEIFGPRERTVNSSHHQAVVEPAAGLRATARTEDGVVEALELADPADHPFFLSVQFHPERTQKSNHAYQRLIGRFVEKATGATGD